MIIIPSIKPELLKSLEVDFSSSVASSIWRKIVNNHTWVERAIPIGCILFFHQSITTAAGDPIDPPNPDIWKFCDGSLISDPDSPLNGQNTPNMADLFPKGPKEGEVEFQIGGNATLDISHNHGGRTGTTDDRGNKNADPDTDHVSGSPHYHSINTKWGVESILPKYFSLQAYIRYK
jgi:hypothetical protein